MIIEAPIATWVIYCFFDTFTRSFTEDQKTLASIFIAAILTIGTKTVREKQKQEI